MGKITGIEIQSMVRHWLNTPMGAYLGSSYGSNIPDLLQLPFSDGLADTVIQKMRADIPILQSLPGGSVNIYGITTSPDKRELLIEVAGQLIGFDGKAAPGRAPPLSPVVPGDPLFAPPSGYTSSISAGITTWVSPACINAGIAAYGSAIWSSAIGGGVDVSMNTPSTRGTSRTQAYSTASQVFMSFLGGVELTNSNIFENHNITDWLATQGISWNSGEFFYNLSHSNIVDSDPGSRTFGLTPFQASQCPNNSTVAKCANYEIDPRYIVLFNYAGYTGLRWVGDPPAFIKITREQAAQYMSGIPTPIPVINAILDSGACIPVTYFEMVLDKGMENATTRVITSSAIVI